LVNHIFFFFLKNALFARCGKGVFLKYSTAHFIVGISINFRKFRLKSEAKLFTWWEFFKNSLKYYCFFLKNTKYKLLIIQQLKVFKFSERNIFKK